MSLRLRLALFVGSALGISMAYACGGGSGTGPPPTPPPSSPTPCIASVAQGLSAVGMRNPFAVRGPSRPALLADVVPDKIAVKFASASHPQADAALSVTQIKPVAAPNPQGWVVYQLPKGQDPTQAVAKLRSMTGVANATTLHYRHMLAATPNDPDLGTVADITPGGDTTTPVQWDKFKMQMPAAWGMTKGSSSIHIAMIDTGYDTTNPDLATKIDATAVFDNGTGQQATCTTSTIQDTDGHGSDTSGIAAADTNNSTLISGTGWNTDLLEARVFPKTTSSPGPSASTTDIAAAINWAVSHGANVINLSLGGSCPDDPVEQDAITAAIGANVTVVAAAGNDGTSTLECPGGDPGVIAVGASALNDTGVAIKETVASYSNWGTTTMCNGGICNHLDLVAPGGDPSNAQVTACGANASSCDFLQWIFNLYSQSAFGGGATEVLIAGTSMSTAQVSGVVSLMYAQDASITPAMVKTILDAKANSDDICSGCVEEGAGRLNASKVLAATP